MSVEAPAAPGSAWDRTTVPGRVLGAVDDAGDALFGPARGQPAVDAVAVALSNLADYGIVWVGLAALKARRRGSRRRPILALAAAGVTSYTVNRAVKQLVRRARPDHSDVPASSVLPVRRPTSSSFPSGHTLAAFCTAVALPERPPGVAVALTFAGAVAASRVHLRAHHLSDVAGGAALGAVLGLVVRAALTLAAPVGRHRSD